MASTTKNAKVDTNGKAGGDKSLFQPIEDIDAVQNEIDQLNEQASEEILKVEQTFNKKRQPFYQKRAGVIEKVPNFWLTVFRNHPQLADCMTPEDAEVMRHLVNIDVQEFDDIKSGYKITLHFSDNEFFKNKTITKEFHIGEPEHYTKCEQVEWLPGKNFTEGKRKDGNKRQAPMEGLFQWFVSGGESAVDEKGEVIKDDIWPNPLQYYLSVEDDEDDDEEEMDPELGEEEDDEDLGEGEGEEEEDVEGDEEEEEDGE